MRLTKKVKVQMGCFDNKDIVVDAIEIENHRLAEEKLCQLEDIEEELGIDLVTLFKALKEGFYYRNTVNGQPNEILFADPENEDCGIECYGYGHYGILWAGLCVAYAKDYGETWGLAKEELE